MRVGAAAAMLLLLFAGSPVTAPPRLNLAAMLDFANGAYQAYQRATERLVVLDHLAPDVNGYRNLWVVVFMDRNTKTLLMGPNMPR